MKSKQQIKLEAYLRKKQIEAKSKQFKFTASGNIRSSFGMTQNIDTLIDKGYLDYNKDINTGYILRKKA